MRSFGWGKLILLMGIFAMASVSGARNAVPSAPVLNFKMTTLGEKGYKVWDLYGQEGNYIDENTLEIRDMELQTYTGECNNAIDSVIKSPNALFHSLENTASSNADIDIQGSGYHVVGDKWEWQGKIKKISIYQNVKVIFFAQSTTQPLPISKKNS